MKLKKMFLLVPVLFLMVAGAAMARDWDKVASLNAGGEAKEVVINREISAVRLVWESGIISIQTVVVRQGAEKTPHTVAARLENKAPLEIKLAGKTQVTGFRISDGGRGVYAVYVK